MLHSHHLKGNVKICSLSKITWIMFISSFRFGIAQSICTTKNKSTMIIIIIICSTISWVWPSLGDMRIEEFEWGLVTDYNFSPTTSTLFECIIDVPNCHELFFSFGFLTCLNSSGCMFLHFTTTHTHYWRGMHNGGLTRGETRGDTNCAAHHIFQN